MEKTTIDPDFHFLDGGGEMGTLTRDYDWSQTALGAPIHWPPSLKTTVSIILSSQFPMFLWWGEELIQFYNDAYRPSFGREGKHPLALGQKAADCWPEIWPIIYPLIQQVRTTGISTFNEDQLIPIYRNGQLEDVYWTFGYSAVRDDSGNVGGVLVICNETTGKIQGIDKLRQSEQKFRALIEEAPVATSLLTGPDFIIEVANQKILEIWRKGNEVIGKPLAEALPEMIGQPYIEILREVFESGTAYESKAAKVERTVNGIPESYYCDFTYKPLLNANGDVYAVMNILIDVTDRVIADKRQLQSQEQILASFEQSPVGIAVLDADNLRFRMANPFYGRLVGREPKDLIDKPLLEALPELAGQGFDELLEQVIATKTSYIANEVPVALLRGGSLETIYVDMSYQPKCDINGEVLGVLVVATDVTLQVLSRKKVEASEAKLRSLIASAPAGMGLFVGRDLIVEFPNQTFIDIVGKGWDIVGKPLREVMPELLTEGQPFLKILDEVFTTGKMFQSPGAQVKIVQNGVMTYNYYNITYTPVLDENNEVYAILDIAIDVTDTVNAIKKAEEAETSLRGAVELAELSTWSLDIENDTYSYSPRFMEWLGFSESTKDLEAAYEPLPEDFRKVVTDSVAEAIKPGGSGIYKLEHPIVNRLTGQERIIHAQAQVFYDMDGNPKTLSGTAQDVTHERKLQQQLEYQVKERTERLQYANAELAGANANLQKSNAELEQFAYIASHDLQEPVRKISTFIKMLKEYLQQQDDKTAHYINRIEFSSERMANLIRDILVYSRVSKATEAFRRVDLGITLKEILNDFELVIEQKHASIDFGDLPVIEAVPLQMTQLFGNLISNSLKYSSKNTKPALSIRSKSLSEEEAVSYHLQMGMKYYCIEFRDNGIGFDPRYADQIFNIFQRLHGKTEYAGTGIGLAMCKKITQNHKGDIFASAQENKGALFVVILPERQH